MPTKSKLKIASGKINIIPLIDIFFLLLIFFLISSSLIFQPGVPVQLPETKASTVRASEKIVVTITENELLFFNDNKVEWSELERQLRKVVAESRRVQAARQPQDEGGKSSGYSPMMVLRADARVEYDKVVQIMSLARRLNLGVYLVTDSSGQQQ